MQIILGSTGISTEHGPYVVGIGVFDGVHLGHQKLLSLTQELAQSAGVQGLAYTFHPHPATVLNPDLAPKLIEPLDSRLERIAAVGLSAVLVEEFTWDFAQMPPESFVHDVLVGRLKARHVIVGSNFTFGRKAAGNLAMLKKLGATHGFGVHPVDLVRMDGIEVSSTKVREFVSTGKVAGARLLLNRFFNISGVVVRGAGRGKTLGFPTANVRVENELLPAVGVYAAFAQGPVGSGVENEPAVVNVGFNPTFGDVGEMKVEAHLLDYGGEHLYGLPLSLDFVERIRDEKRFAEVEELKRQVGRDVDAARKFLRQARAG